MTKKERYIGVIKWFEKNMPEPKTELKYKNNFQLLIAVMLSAQCTDKRVNIVTPNLFNKYPTPQSMSLADINEILKLIKSISYPKSKATHLKEMATQITKQFNGEIPNNMKDLQSLMGVGRKTANVMLAVAFGKNVMPVDTHVQRVSNRIGLVKTSTPIATEKELVKNIPNNILSKSHHWLLLHGRYICKAKNPNCNKCGISDLCLFFSKENI